MKNVLYLIIILVLSAVISAVTMGAAEADSLYDFTLKSIDGNDTPLKNYQGHVILVVNTASKCGLTPQYKKLQAVYEKYKDKGFVVLGFPANNFRHQEPGSEAEIKTFCTVNYGVTFPMFAKISVLGEDIHPLYRYLTSKTTNPKFSGEIRWNFDKFLIDKKGQIINRFHPKTTPDSAEVAAAVEAAL